MSTQSDRNTANTSQLLSYSSAGPESPRPLETVVGIMHPSQPPAHPGIATSSTDKTLFLTLTSKVEEDAPRPSWSKQHREPQDTNPSAMNFYSRSQLRMSARIRVHAPE